MKVEHQFSRRIFEIFFPSYLSLFFLALALDFPDFILLRMILGAALAGGYAVFYRQKGFASFRFSPAWIFFGCFLLYQVIRCAWAFITRFSGASLDPEFLKAYLFGPVWFFLPFAFLSIGFSLYNSRKSVMRLLQILTGWGFFMSLVILPNLLAKGAGKYYYLDKQGEAFLWPQALLSIDWIPKYILGIYTHPNILGDLIAIGCFTGLGLAFYAFYLFQDSQKMGKESASLRELAIFLTAGLVSGAAVLLLFSRGTLLFFGPAILVYFILLAVKFPSKIQTGITVVVFAGVFLFFAWAGNLSSAWKELQTLQDEKMVLDQGLENEAYKGKSIHHNLEGIRIAKAMAADHPVWGIGTREYSRLSNRYIRRSLKDAELIMARIYVMNHYFQKLAEEGVGAYLYFLFILSYILETAWKLFRTQSRFKFIMGLSLAMPVMVILGHALINDLMDHFTVSMPVYMMMGAGLGILRKDFQHDPV